MKRSATTQPQTEAAKLVKITVYDFECANTLAGDLLQSLLLKVASLSERMQLAVESGAKRILIPIENKRDLADVADSVLTATQWQFYDSPTKVAIMAMGMG